MRPLGALWEDSRNLTPPHGAWATQGPPHGCSSGKTLQLGPYGSGDGGPYGTWLPTSRLGRPGKPNEPTRPTRPTVSSAPEAELPARGGRDQHRLLLAARGCGVLLLPRVDWPRNVNARYLNLGRAQRTAVTNCESRVCWDSYASVSPARRPSVEQGRCGPRAPQQ